MRIKLRHLVAGLVAFSAPVWATETAITKEPVWLSDVFSPRTRTSTQSTSGGLITEQIDVQTLDSGQGRRIGVLPPDQSGIPVGIWGQSDPENIARLITPYLPTALPQITAFWHALALAETQMPPGEGGMTVLRARVDHLLNAGALDQAEALLENAGHLTPDLFNRAFDAGLLTGRADTACSVLRADPSLSPDMQARIFCLARAGDWPAAALTLRTAESLGRLDADEAALLARFLDPDLFEDDPVPPHPGKLNALDFTMREALGLPRVAGRLPLAFLHADLDNTTPWRARVLATERLARSQAIAPAQLLELYREGTPAASGGVWVRVDAVQSLFAAIENADPEAVAQALVTAYGALSEAGLGFTLSQLAANELRDVPLSGEAARLRFDLWLMHPDHDQLVWDHEPQNRIEANLVAIATSRPEEVTPRTDVEAAVQAGLTRSDLRLPVLWDVAQNRRGEAILKALTALVQSRHADPQAIELSLTVLRRSGLGEDARGLALQVLLAAEGRL